jgi:hypothetical protein
MTVGEISRWPAPTARLRIGAVFLGLLPLLLLTSPASGAAAGAGEVYWDPDTPAGKEYVIPHEEARSLGQSGGSSRATGRQLFGTGIYRPRSPGAGRALADPPSRAGRRRPRVYQPERPRGASTAARSSAVQTSGGPPPALFAGGGAAIVLLAGGVGIAVVRLLSRQD